MKLSKLLVCSLFAVLVTNPLHAAELSVGMKAQLKKLEIPFESVRETPVKGLYEVQLGSRVYYLSGDGDYLLIGDMIDMGTRKNLTEERLGGIRVDAIDTIKPDQLISFKAPISEHSVTVFTDIECGYCRKLHSEMAEYNKLGITVNYLFYPRAGLGSSSYQSAVSVWCSKDRNDALTRAKSGEKLPRSNCDNPVERHFELGQSMEISGTPAIVTQTGTLLPGYVPPAILKQRLDQDKTQKVADRQRK